MPNKLLEMKKWQTILILFLLLVISQTAFAADCPVCSAQDISSLAMLCPDCGANLHDNALKYHSQPRSSLKIRLLYIGDRPDRLPPYGKLYINGKYRGNIDLTERQENNSAGQVWANGLGKDFSAAYEKTLENLSPGTMKIEVEMKFDRMFGFGRSYKRVSFPYVSFNAGEQTTVAHYFLSATTFHQYKPVRPAPIPIISETKIQAASGTVAINVPLF